VWRRIFWFIENLKCVKKRSLSCWKHQVSKVSKVSSKTFNILKECFLYHLCSKCLLFKWSPWKYKEVWWWQLSPLEVQNAHDVF
jgi:hypothetical protein